MLGPSFLPPDALLVGIKLHNITQITPCFFFCEQIRVPLLFKTYYKSKQFSSPQLAPQITAQFFKLTTADIL